jgi:hypothetical protein
MSARSNLAIDLVIAAAFVVADNPPLSGATLHEWLGIALGAALVFHTATHWDWIARVTVGLLGRPGRGVRLTYAVDVLLFTALTVTVFSGLMMSRHLMPALGLSMPGAGGWRGIHELGADLSLVAIGVHVGLHWRWVVSALPRLLNRRVEGAAARPNETATHSLAPDAAE